MTGTLRHNYLEATAQILEILGVAAIVAGAVFAIVAAGRSLIWRDGNQKIFDQFRTRLAKSILIGVEFLIAADIIGTVIVEPTAESLGVLAMIVLVRTFLSFSLEVEIEGRWPWHRQRRRHEDD